MAIETPCINVCILDPATQLCRGCARTLDEIGRWAVMSALERKRIMAELPARRSRLEPSASGAAGSARG